MGIFLLSIEYISKQILVDVGEENLSRIGEENSDRMRWTRDIARQNVKNAPIISFFRP